jgi:tRNA A37 threonylcarbamoyladenosine dehydratase
MGAGAKFDATKVRVTDIAETYQCPLAHMLRKRLHKMGIRSGFKAVFSEEQPIESAMVPGESCNKKTQVGTISYIPAVFGCVCAQTVICDLMK